MNTITNNTIQQSRFDWLIVRPVSTMSIQFWNKGKKKKENLLKTLFIQQKSDN